MCGIAGIVSIDKNEVSVQRLKSMTDAVAHRGPDGEGQWINEQENVGLGHRRLSIIDLSCNASQPMHYLNKYTIIFNGEIYNYIELKESLLKQGYQFRSESDTEVIMALYDKEKENCLELFDGMFSFVIYDKESNEIFAARDRFGEKPFFYAYKSGEYFLFGSEMKCLWAAGIPKEVNNRMLFMYLSYGEVQNPNDLSETFFNHCYSLPHGHYLKLTVNDITLSITKYYQINYKNIDYSITEPDAQERFRELFYTSVKRRLRSDVTVGSSLSGGLDSSLVVCVIDKLKKNTLQLQNTFSAVFPGFAKDERKYIDFIVAKTKVAPHFTTPDANGIINVMEKLFWHQEEPFGSASIYIQYCVMQLAKENKVTVLLDGQGADEYLAGYHSYYTQFFNDLKINFPGRYPAQHREYKDLHRQNLINPIMKKDLKYLIRSKIPGAVKPLKKILNYYNHKTSPIFSSEFYDAYHAKDLVSEHHSGDLNGILHQSIFNGGLQTLLRYADRNSMAHSREVRLPFLFHELVEFVFTLPPYFKINNGWTKWIMRSSFSDVLPKQIVWRKDKIGYEPPQKDWLENQQVIEKIQESKRKLFDQKIISKKEFESNLVSKESSVQHNKSWSLLMAGQLF